MTAQTSSPRGHQQQAGKSRAGRGLTVAVRTVVALVAVMGALFVLFVVGLARSVQRACVHVRLAE